eukprot:SAG31_NODE_8945_length_1358_cov_4.965052_1_plen_274_part_00
MAAREAGSAGPAVVVVVVVMSQRNQDDDQFSDPGLYDETFWELAMATQTERTARSDEEDAEDEESRTRKTRCGYGCGFESDSTGAAGFAEAQKHEETCPLRDSQEALASQEALGLSAVESQQPPEQKFVLDKEAFVRGSGVCVLNLVEDPFLLRTPGGATAVQWWLDFMGSWKMNNFEVLRGNSPNAADRFHWFWKDEMGTFLGKLLVSSLSLSLSLSLSPLACPLALRERVTKFSTWSRLFRLRVPDEVLNLVITAVSLDVLFKNLSVWAKP